MLTEAEFAEAVEAVRNDHEPSIPDLIAHDRAQRAEIERLSARAEKYLDAMTDLTALRAKVREYLAAIDFDDDETAPPDLCEACQRTERAKAALRAEVEK
jgi:hypothetical protein